MIQPDVVCSLGWSSSFSLAVAFWAKKNQRRAILFSASTESDFRRNAVSEAVKRNLVRLFGSALVGGQRQEHYLLKLNFPADRIFYGYNVVDNAKFAGDLGGFFNDGQTFRGDGGDVFTFLCVARLVDKKNLVIVLNALSMLDLQEEPERARLIVCGDGPLMSYLEGVAQKLGVEKSVSFVGSVPYDGMPEVYSLANVLILPSISEQWGLVVNEAMAAGLPVLVPQRCGCAPDLVQTGFNGFTFDPLNAEELRDLMRGFLNGAFCQYEMGKASRGIIERWGPARFAEGLDKAIGATLNAPVSKISLSQRLLLWCLIRR